MSKQLKVDMIHDLLTRIRVARDIIHPGMIQLSRDDSIYAGYAELRNTFNSLEKRIVQMRDELLQSKP